MNKIYFTKTEIIYDSTKYVYYISKSSDRFRFLIKQIILFDESKIIAG